MGSCRGILLLVLPLLWRDASAFRSHVSDLRVGLDLQGAFSANSSDLRAGLDHEGWSGLGSNGTDVLGIEASCKKLPPSPKGHPKLQTHRVTTTDGVELVLWRVPGKQGAKPVLVLSGLECTSRDWFTGLSGNALPWILSNAGFDVWLGNNRGTVNSVTKTWGWTFEEMADFDMPAMVEGVLSVSGASSLDFIGHSQGALQGLMYFSSGPGAAKQVSHLVALAPAVFLTLRRWTWQFMAGFHLDQLAPGTGSDKSPTSFAPYEDLQRSRCMIMCEECKKDMGGSFMEGRQGFAKTCRSKFQCIPAGTSSMNMRAFGDLSRDHPKDGFKGYLEKKGRKLELHKLTMPVLIAGGQDDLFITPDDLKRLVREWSDHGASPPSMCIYTAAPGVGHMDLVWGSKMPGLLYRRLASWLTTKEEAFHCSSVESAAPRRAGPALLGRLLFAGVGLAGWLAGWLAGTC